MGQNLSPLLLKATFAGYLIGMNLQSVQVCVFFMEPCTLQFLPAHSCTMIHVCVLLITSQQLCEHSNAVSVA